jgi:O-methyltransferase
MTPKTLARTAIQRKAPWLLWPTPESASSLQIARKYVYLHALHERRQLAGDVLEVGSYLGGTAAMAAKFLHQINSPRRYVCIDTFDGFVPAQYEADPAPDKDAGLFAEASIDLVEKLFKRWEAPQVEVAKGDICDFPTRLLPRQIVVCLLDVDLGEPIYRALGKIVPRLTPGGVVLVDDCVEGTTWAGARQGYERWCDGNGRVAEYVYGFGVVHG